MGTSGSVLESWLVVVDVEVEGVDTTVFVVDPDIFESTAIRAGVGPAEELAGLNCPDVQRASLDIKAVVKTIDIANPSISDRPSLAITLIQLNARAEWPVPRTSRVKGIAIKTSPTIDTGTIEIINGF